MDYLQKARDHSIQWSIDSKGDQEFIFDKIGLEYFLDSIGFDTVNNKVIKDDD